MAQTTSKRVTQKDVEQAQKRLAALRARLSEQEAVKDKAPAKVKHLTRSNRKDFVKAASWAKGLSTVEIARLVVSGEQKAPKGWGIGERYTALVSD
jgi:hypothetical protein